MSRRYASTTSLDIEGGVRRYFCSMNKTRLLLFVFSFVLVVIHIPIDILRQQYVWTEMNEEQEKIDTYRVLVGHCECFIRDTEGKLPSCVRAYSMVWTGVTVLQFFITVALLSTEWIQLLHHLTGAYVATVIILFCLFIDCGVLTEDDCYIVYLLSPVLIYAGVLLIYNAKQNTQKSRISCL